MSLAFDHVLLCARDIDAAARSLFEDHGLASLPGGRHPGHGTANRIVPLGDSYLELIGVVDPREAAESSIGRWVDAETARGPHLLGLCLRTDDLDAIGARVAVSPVTMSRATPSGATLSWRLVGADRAFGPDRMPFFISWDDMAAHPGRDRAAHRIEPQGIAWVELGGDEPHIDAWLGDHDLDLRLVGGITGPRAVGIRTAAGEIVLR